MQSRHNPTKAPQDAEVSHAVGITRRKKSQARILPPEKNESVEFPDYGMRAETIWGESWAGVGSDELIEKARGER